MGEGGMTARKIAGLGFVSAPFIGAVAYMFATSGFLTTLAGLGAAAGVMACFIIGFWLASD
jgi:hypothetical protein